MEDKQAQQYLNRLIEEQGKNLEGLEKDTFDMFMNLRSNLLKAQQHKQKLQVELEHLINSIKRADGQVQACCDLLIRAEESRQQCCKQRIGNMIQEKIDNGEAKLVTINSDSSQIPPPLPHTNKK
jgi:hypothetical protein